MTLNFNHIKIVLSVFLLGILLFSCKSESEHNRIDTMMKKLHQNGNFNGAILVAEKGKIIYDTILGDADLSRHIPLNKNTDFYLASLSKQFTAMGIMMLEEQDKLSYDDAIVKYFPQLPAYSKQITIRNLLNHTSGLKDYFNTENLVKPGLTNAEVLAWLNTQKELDFKPGEKFNYTNTGYLLLSMIIEKVVEKPFSIFMNEAIFKPLNMTRTLAFDKVKLDLENRAVGFTKEGKLDDYTIRTMGDGGIFSTTQDLFLWDQALYENKLVNENTLKEAFTQPKLNNGKLSDYGFGWFIIDDIANKVVYHTGGLNGYQTIIWRDLGHEITIIMLTNKGESFPLWDTTNSILKIVGAKQYIEN